MITILILVAFILSIMAAAVCSYTSRVQGFLHQGSLCLPVNSYCSWNEVVIHCSFDSVSLPSQPHPTKALFGQMFLEEEECSPWLISRETHIKATKEGHCTGVLRAVTVGEQEIIEHAEKVKPLCGVCREAKWSNSAKTEISQADPPMILQSHFWWQHTYVKEWFPVHHIITFPTARQESNSEQIKCDICTEWSFYDPQRGKKPGHTLQQEPGGHIMSARHWQTHRMIPTMWSIVLAVFPVAWLKHLDKNHLREKGFISAHSQKLCKKTKLTLKKTQIWNGKRKPVSEFKKELRGRTSQIRWSWGEN